jgi:hypothetical protein
MQQPLLDQQQLLPPPPVLLLYLLLPPPPQLLLVLPLHYLLPTYLPQQLLPQQLLPLVGQRLQDLNNLVDRVDMQLHPDKQLQQPLVLAVFAQR